MVNAEVHWSKSLPNRWITQLHASFLVSYSNQKASCTSQKLPQSHQALQVLILTRFWTLVSKWTKWNGSSLMVCQKGTHKWKLIPCKAKDDLVLPPLLPSDSLLATAKDSVCTANTTPAQPLLVTQQGCSWDGTGWQAIPEPQGSYSHSTLGW